MEKPTESKKKPSERKFWWVIYQGKYGKYVQQLIKSKKDCDCYRTTEYAVSKNPNILPIVVNSAGGYHSFNPNGMNIVRIVRRADEPVISLDEAYLKNSSEFDCGWISPEGDTYQCGYEGHRKCATFIFKAYYPDEDTWNSDEDLIKKGWVEIYFNPRENNKISLVRYDDFENVTDAQCQVIIKHNFYKVDRVSRALLKLKDKMPPDYAE